MLKRTEHDQGVVIYQSPLLRRAGVPHGFTTRLGGVSGEPYDTLNLASSAKAPNTDANTNIAENFRRVRRALGCLRHIRVQVNQVHGNEIWLPPAEPIRPADAPRADAIATERPGLLLMVRVADCVPVLLSDSSGRVVSAIHAGWRGGVAGVVQKAVETIGGSFGVEASDLVSAVGPCIGLAHFEVGPEVVSAFEQAGLGDAVDTRTWDKPHIDLARAVTHQLKRAGITGDRIDRTDRCTYQNAEEFFSHRRGPGRTGRQAALIAAKPR